MGSSYSVIEFQNESVDNKFSTREYNNRMFYDLFNNLFTADFGIPVLNLPVITIDDITCLNKRDCYTPYLLPSRIYVSSEIMLVI